MNENLIPIKFDKITSIYTFSKYSYKNTSIIIIYACTLYTNLYLLDRQIYI